MSRYKQYYGDWEDSGFNDDIPDTGNWWQNEENYYYQSHYYQHRRHKAQTYQQRGYAYDSIEQARQVLETYGGRTQNLINSILGKKLTLKLANNYGIDKKNIYLNYADTWLTFMTEDAFLGKISQLLSKGLYYETGNEKRVQTDEKEYLPLFQTLETARNYRQLADDFGGAEFYLATHWQEVGTDQVLDIEHDMLKGILGLVHGDMKLAKGIPKKALSLVSQYLDSDSKTDSYSLYEQIKPFYNPPKDEQEQEKLQDQVSQATNNALTTSDKRQAQDATGKKKGKKGGNQQSNGYQGGGIAPPKTPEVDRTFYARTVAKHRQVIGVLTKQLQSILADNETKHYVRPFKRGKIDKKRLYKVAVGNPRIFKQLAEPNAKNYAFALVLDQSSSMEGGTITFASEAVVVVSKVLADLGLPFAIYGFSDTPFIYKQYSDTISPDKFSRLLNTYGGTNDTAMFRKVKADMYHDLQTAVITVTDGGSNDATTARAAISEIEGKTFQNRVYGIGIGGMRDEDMKRTYNRGVAIPSVNDLSRTLTGLIKAQFRR